MLKAPMAKRHRGRTRARREAPPAQRRAVTPERSERVEREESPVPRPAARPAHRPARGAARPTRAGFSRASGDASAALQRAAIAERTFVSKDFRRLGLVIVVCAVLLVVSGFVERALVR